MTLEIAADLRKRLRQRQTVYGSWLSIGHPELAALFAAGETDFLGIDLEHTATDLPACQAIIRTCHEFRKACLPRIFAGDIQRLCRLLDMGADGIILPQVSSRADVETVNQVMRYPPAGKRGFGVAAAHQYGRIFDSYVKSANEALVLMVQVENTRGVDAIEEIVSHPSVDGVMVGPYDLSGSLGVPGVLDHPKVLEASRRVISVCRQKKVSCGLHLVYPDLEQIRRNLELGFSFLILGSDIFNLCRRGLEVDKMIQSSRRP